MFLPRIGIPIIRARKRMSAEHGMEQASVHELPRSIASPGSLDKDGVHARLREAQALNLISDPDRSGSGSGDIVGNIDPGHPLVVASPLATGDQPSALVKPRRLAREDAGPARASDRHQRAGCADRHGRRPGDVCGRQCGPHVRPLTWPLPQRIGGEGRFQGRRLEACALQAPPLPQTPSAEAPTARGRPARPGRVSMTV